MPTLQIALIFLFLGCCKNCLGQPSATDSVLPYLHGVRTPDALTLDVRGCEVFVEEAAGDFSKPYFSRMFPRFDLHQGHKPVPDSGFDQAAFRVEQLRTKGKRDSAHMVFYFFQKTPSRVLGIAIISLEAIDEKLQQAIAWTMLTRKIPDTLVTQIPSRAKELRFAGRTIPVDSRCNWEGPAVLQCPGFGEINWSLHPTEAEAAACLAQQLQSNTARSQLTVEEDERVPVMFEETEVEARRIRYRLKGVIGAMAKNAEGSRMLVVYYITAPVRGRWVRFVGSYWTSDYLKPSGLPPLLDAIMRPKM